MNIPGKLKIGGHDIGVDVVTYRETDLSGYWQEQYHIIGINKESRPEDSHGEIVLHEILEAINSIAELNLEHKVITDLGQWLFMVLRDNNLDFRK